MLNFLMTTELSVTAIMAIYVKFERVEKGFEKELNFLFWQFIEVCK